MNIPYPYHLSSAEQNRRMDERTITEFGIDGFTLMEIAGTRAADFIMSNTEDHSHGLFLCGKGNNAGDALVIARLLSQNGYSCTIHFALGEDSLSGDTQKNLGLLRKLDANITFEQDLKALKADSFDFVVDGIFGTGLSSEVREPIAGLIKKVNEMDLPVFSLDLPSGMDADTGRILGVSIQADYTLNFGSLKTGCFLNDGFDTCGEIILCDLPFPVHFREKAAAVIDRNWLEHTETESKTRRHKYAEGVLYIIAGSEGLTGAATLCAQSAWSAGLGAVVLITPKGLLDIYEKTLVQIIKKAVGSDEDVYFKSEHAETVLQILKDKPGKLIIGPGLGREEETVRFAQQILSEFEGDVLIDADALHALSVSGSPDPPLGSHWILTPHPGELAALLDSATVSKDDFDRLIQIAKFSKEHKLTILSKGMPSMVSDSSGQAYLTSYDTRIFSRAGFGDVLAGKAGAYWIHKKSPELACFYALLDGKEKADHLLSDGQRSLEPLDLI